MRLGKTILLVILLIFGYVMQCNLFQRALSGIGSDKYFSMDLSYSTNEEYDAVISAIAELSQAYGVCPYAVLTVNESDIERRIHIYGDDAAKSALEAEYGITARTYESPSDGSSTLQFHRFLELESMDTYFAQKVYFIGGEAAVFSVYEGLSEAYAVSCPVSPGPFEEDMTYIIWAAIDMILIMMTVLSAAMKKKETVVRIFMGQDSGFLILKDSILEIITDVSALIFVKLFVPLFMSGEYMERECIAVYLAGVLLSALVYVSYAFYDIRSAFSNRFVSGRVTAGTHILKFVMSVATIFVVITNIDLIMQSKMSLGSDGFITAFRDYYYMELVDVKIPGRYDDGREDTAYALANSIYVDNYDSFRPVVSTLALEDEDSGVGYVLVNEFGADTIEDFIKETEIEDDTDVVIFIPEQYDAADCLPDADYCLSKLVENGEQLNRKIIVYHEDKTFWYVNRNLDNNMSRVENPVVIYACFSGSAHKEDLCIDDAKNVMYKMDGDAGRIEAAYGLGELGYKIVLTKVSTRFDYYNAYLKQGIAFCSSIAIFIFLLQFILIMAVIWMEYKNNAMELSLKKIYGYGFLKRFRPFLCKSIISGLAAACVSAVIGVLTERYQLAEAFKTGAVLLLAELIMDAYFVLKNEKTNVIKVLKGGSL